jgi:hypothetical protein
MKYSEMVKQAISSGGGEAMMWKSVERVDCLLEKMKEEEPGKYWDFIRKAHEDMYGEHFDKQFAEYEVSQMYATDKDGHGKSGEHWSLQQLKAATAGKQFPKGTTEWDIYVAYNACAYDFGKEFSDEDILIIAYTFFFSDEDWSPEGSGGKVWRYFCAKHKK